MAIKFDPRKDKNEAPNSRLSSASFGELSSSNNRNSFASAFIHELADRLGVEENCLISDKSKSRRDSLINLERTSLPGQLRLLRKPIVEQERKTVDNPKTPKLKLVFSKS